MMKPIHRVTYVAPDNPNVRATNDQMPWNAAISYAAKRFNAGCRVWVNGQQYPFIRKDSKSICLDGEPKSLPMKPAPSATNEVIVRVPVGTKVIIEYT